MVKKKFLNSIDLHRKKREFAGDISTVDGVQIPPPRTNSEHTKVFHLNQARNNSLFIRNNTEFLGIGMKETQIIISGIILVSLIIGIYFYPQMPERMAFHWNLEGQADGYVSKSLALFFIPFLSVGLFLLFFAIPKIDPLKENIEKFRKHYDGVVVLIILFLFYLHLLTISWNFDIRFGMIQALAPAFGILYYYLGILSGNVKRNWFIGIRTPWTISNEIVWEKTHKIGAPLLKACGVIAFLGLVFENFALYFIVLPILSVAVYTTVYSYFEYRKEVLKTQGSTSRR